MDQQDCQCQNPEDVQDCQGWNPYIYIYIYMYVYIAIIYYYHLTTLGGTSLSPGAAGVASESVYSQSNNNIL